MHLLFLISVGSIAIALRLLPPINLSATDDISRVWGITVLRFAVPPLLLLSTAIALLGMGPRHMHGMWQDSVCHGMALLGLLALGAIILKQFLTTVQLLQPLQAYPKIVLDGQLVRWLPTDQPFAAETGLWQTEHLISHGLLSTLSHEQRTAVLAHEAGHCHHRDTFWFFWLGCLRQWSAWLPNTDSLWHTLLTVRELRADQFAARFCDRLILAETLFDVAHQTIQSDFGQVQGVAALCDDLGGDRLALRIEALLDNHQTEPTKPIIWRWLWSVTIPFSVIPLCSCW